MNTTTPPPLIVQIPPGDLGALHSLAAMRAAADRLAARPEAIELAQRLYPERSTWESGYAIGAAVFAFLKTEYNFAADPARAELVRDPIPQLRAALDFPRSRQLVGDCDDRAVVTAALCQARGHRARFIIVSSDARRPFHHVYAAIEVPAGMVGRRLVALDSQVCDRIDQHPPGIVRRYTEGETIRPANLLDENGNPYQESSQ